MFTRRKQRNIPHGAARHHAAPDRCERSVSLFEVDQVDRLDCKTPKSIENSDSVIIANSHTFVANLRIAATSNFSLGRGRGRGRGARKPI